MKKQLLLTALLFASVFSVSAQYQRRILVEEFTNASCPPCAAQNPGFNALLASKYDHVTPVKYQTSWPGVDPMNAQNPTEVQTRVDYYAVSGVPYGVVDGTPIFDDCGYTGAPGCLDASEVDAAVAITTPVKMDVTYTLSPDFTSITANVSVTSDVALTGNLVLHVAVVEDAIYFGTAPGTNGETEFFQPVRKMLPDAAGTATGDFAAGETKTYTLTWAIPAYIYNENQLGVSAWLQDNGTQAVYQSFRAAPTTPKITIESTNSFFCTSGQSPTFTFTNIADENLTTATFRYRLGTNAWQDLNWTGNLAPGASEEVTLTGIQITQAGNNTVNVLAVNSNNGALQTTINEGYATITVKGFFTAGLALPIANTFQTGAFPPAGWNVSNIGTRGWKLATNAGSGSTRSVKNDMYFYSEGTTSMILPKIDLSTTTGATTLTFDHAYAFYTDANGSLYDSLRVDVSGDCGLTWTTVLYDGGETMATGAATSSEYVPQAGEWASHSIDISNLNGNGNVFVRFNAITGYGNDLYVDNINVTLASGVKNLDLTTFAIQPNPTSDRSEVRFGLSSAQNVHLMVYDALGALVQSRDLGELTSGEHFVSMDALRLSNGSYRVVLQGAEGIAQSQWVVLK